MSECLYAKYNRHRRPRFRIETSIRGDGEKKVVVKRALTPEAEDHLRDLASAYTRIKENITGKQVRLPGGFRHDGARVIVDFIDGVSLDRMLLDAVLERDAGRFRGIIDRHKALLQDGLKTVPRPVVTEELKRVFGLNGADDLEGHPPYFALTMIDPLFENILVRNDLFYLIDNEWVFEGCLPVSFVLFRSLFYFYKVKYADFGVESLAPFDAELARLGIDAGAAERYRRMDDSLQAYVFGEEWGSSHRQRYAKARVSVHSLEQAIEQQRAVIKDMHEQIVYLTDLAGEKDQLITEMRNSLGWRFARGIERMFDGILPRGTRRRRLAKRLFGLQVIPD